MSKAGFVASSMGCRSINLPTVKVNEELQRPNNGAFGSSKDCSVDNSPSGDAVTPTAQSATTSHLQLQSANSGISRSPPIRKRPTQPPAVAQRDQALQRQFALGRGITTMLTAFGTRSRRLPSPRQSFGLIHCSRSGMKWTLVDAIFLLAGTPRLGRDGRYFDGAANAIYKYDVKLDTRWGEMEDLHSHPCWGLVSKEYCITIWQAPLHNRCPIVRYPTVLPSLCAEGDNMDDFWNVHTKTCAAHLPENCTILTPTASSEVLMLPKRLGGRGVSSDDADILVDADMVTDTEFFDLQLLSKIATYTLFVSLVANERHILLDEGTYKGAHVNVLCHFFGSQTRVSLPFKFVCDCTYVLGHIGYHITAALTTAAYVAVIFRRSLIFTLRTRCFLTPGELIRPSQAQAQAHTGLL